MSAITTHVLDTARGRPAAGVAVSLERHAEGSGWHEVGRGITDADGRLRNLLPEGQRPAAGAWRLRFAVGHYQASHGGHSFYPEVTVEFTVDEPGHHYHVPLLLGPFGYTTYRGS